MFAETYFKRFLSEKPFLKDPPNPDLFLSVVIPAYNESGLLKSLESLKKCRIGNKAVEVIVVVNASEKSTSEIITQNRVTYREVLRFKAINDTNRLMFHVLNLENLPHKFAGVGLARKIGMDEALRRFNGLNKPGGLIAGFDADSTVQADYFIEVERFFAEKPATKACSVRFEHPVTGNEFAPEIYRNIVEYELHLRYFVEALKYADFPFAYHTIGSAFVVRADIYAAQGGMNKRKAGEDFYFLQKIIPLGHYETLNNTCVYPSPRISDRVPFGTGAAVKKMIENGSSEYLTYNFETFDILKHFFSWIEHSYQKKCIPEMHPVLAEFLEMNDFKTGFIEIKNNSTDVHTFNQRFFLWFNAFRVIKFLNFAHEHYYTRQPVKKESLKLLKIIKSEHVISDNTENILFIYRKIQS